MNPLLAILWLSLCLEALAHERSPEMARELNAPVPEWMSIAEPIKVKPINDRSILESLVFRPRSGGVANSRNRVQMPEHGIEIQFPHNIDWRGVNQEGYGVSLHQDGRRLLVNTGMTTRLYEISLSGEYREVPLRLPHVTYDEGLKGWILGWSWAGSDVLVGRGLILDESGHEVIEGRLYVFYLREKALARLDLSALNLPDDAVTEVASIGEDLEHLKIRLGDRELAVKADLKSPPRLLVDSDSAPASRAGSIEKTPAQEESISRNSDLSTAVEDASFSKFWPPLAAVVLAAICLSWVLLKRRGRGQP